MRPTLYLQLASGQDGALADRVAASGLGWIISAQYALRGRQGLAARIDEVPRLLIDPQTMRLDLSLGWGVARDGGEKPAYRRLWDEFLRGFPPERAQEMRRMGWRDVSDEERRTLALNVLSFQTRCLDMGRAFDEELFGVLPPSTRRVAPDVLMGSSVLVRDEASLHEQAALYAATPRRWEQLPVERVLVLHPAALDRDRVIRALRRIEWGDARIWISLPGFRELVVPRRLGPTALRLRSLIRMLAARGPVGLLGGSFPLCTLISDGIDSVAFGPHLESGRVRAGSGGPLAQAYVPAVHGWVSYDEVAHHLRRCSTRSQVAEVFCADEQCLGLLDRVGMEGFCREMFATVDTIRGPFADPTSRKLQDEHAVRARLLEIEMVSQLSRTELARVLAIAARRSPFVRPAEYLGRWAAILRIEELAAA